MSDCEAERTSLEGRENSREIPSFSLLYDKETDRLVGGTIEKLVEVLTAAINTDSLYLQQFLLTYRTFTTSRDLLNMLIARFLSATEDSTDGKVIRLRVFNVLKHWVEKHWMDFAEDPELVSTLNQFVTGASLTMAAPCDQLLKLLMSQGEGSFKNRFHRSTSKLAASCPTPFLLPYSSYKKKFSKGNRLASSMKDNFTSENLTLLDIHPVEIARQLTLAEWKMFCDISHGEFLGLSWMKKDKETKAKGIISFISRFNQVSVWVLSEVLRVEDIKKRAMTIGHMIKIAKACDALNNFNSSMEILAGLSNGSVTRLKQTWSLLSAKKMADFQELSNFMESNFKILRERIHLVQPPCIPYLGVYLSDLTFIEEGNSDFYPNGLINFNKCRLIANVMQEVIQMQYTPYFLEEIPSIMQFLEKSFNAFRFNEEERYQQSLKIEPRVHSDTLKKFELSSSGEDISKTFFEQQVKSLNFHDKNTTKSSEDVCLEMISSLENYRFNEKDDKSNIQWNENLRNGSVVSATLTKLIERLTYHRTDSLLNDIYHRGLKCSDCNTKIYGYRYRCLSCSIQSVHEHNQCEQCWNKPFHKINHVFLKFCIPSFKLPSELQKSNWIPEIADSMEQTHNGVFCSKCGQELKGSRLMNLLSDEEICASCERLRSVLDDCSQVYIIFKKPLVSDFSVPQFPPVSFRQDAPTFKEKTFLDAFLLTYRSFTTPITLLNLLIERFLIPKPKISNAEAVNLFQKNVVKPIKMKILKVFETWMNDYWPIDFKEDVNLREILSDFLNGQLNFQQTQNQSSSSEDADIDLERMLIIANHKFLSMSSGGSHLSASGPTLTNRKMMISLKKEKVIERGSLFSFSAKELAQQLGLLEFSQFKSIEPLGYLTFLETHKSHQIEKVLERSEQTTRWACSEILKETNLEKQSQIIQQLFQIAKCCMNENNFNTAEEILSALAMETVKSIESVWAIIPESVLQDLQEVRLLMEQSKTKLNKAPSLPHLKSVLGELSMIYNSTDNILPNNGLINFEKFQTIAEKILQIKACTEISYAYQPNSSVRNYLISSFEEILDDETMKKLSEQKLRSSQKLLATLGASSPQEKPKKSTFARITSNLKKRSSLIGGDNSPKRDLFDDQLLNRTNKELIAIIRNLESQLKEEKEARMNAEEQLQLLQRNL